MLLAAGPRPLSITLLSLLGVAASGCRTALWGPRRTSSPRRTAGGGRRRPKTDGGRQGPRHHRYIFRRAASAAADGGAGRERRAAAAARGRRHGRQRPDVQPNSPDRQTDISNCGTCFNSCLVPNSILVRGRAVPIQLLPDFFDADKDPTNGCECVKTNAGVERRATVSTTTATAPSTRASTSDRRRQLRRLQRHLLLPVRDATCKRRLPQGACLPGFYDRVPTVPGCETACKKSNGGIEIYDGQDNDCDGIGRRRPDGRPRSSASRWASAPASRRTAWDRPARSAATRRPTRTSRTRPGPATAWTTIDGRVDEAFQIGQACTVGSGACANPTHVGLRQQPRHHRSNGSPKPPGPRPATASTTTATARSTSSTRPRTAPATTS